MDLSPPQSVPPGALDEVDAKPRLGPRIHLRVRILPPSDVVRPPDPITLLVNISPESSFLSVWSDVERRYRRDYRGPMNTWVFKKIQDAYGADICLTDTVGDVFLGEDRSKCIVNVIQRQSHREETIPLGSRLQPQPDTPDQLDSEQVARLRAQEARYGATLDNLDPDRPVYSNERELPPHGSQGDDGGISPPSKYPVASSSRAVSVVSKRRSLSLEGTIQQSQAEHVAKSQFDDGKLSSAHDPVSPNPPRPCATSPEIPPHQDRRHDAPSSQPAASTNQVSDGVHGAQQHQPKDNNLQAVGHDQDQVEYTSSFVQDSAGQVDEDMVDPLEDEEGSPQPRLTGGMRHPDISNISPVPDHSMPNRSEQSGPKSQRRQNLSRSWSEQDNEILVDALARGLDGHDIHKTHFAQRSWEAVRKKMRAVEKHHAGKIMARKKTLAVMAAKPLQAKPSEQPSGPAAKVVELKRARLLTWSAEDDALFVEAIRKGQDWRTLRDRRFPAKSDHVIKQHFAEIRRKVQQKDDIDYAQQCYQDQVKRGQPSSRPDQKYFAHEDDLLLAARLEQVEMKRLIQGHFPLRHHGEVVRYASKLFHDAKRDALRKRETSREMGLGDIVVPTIEPDADEVMASLDHERRERVDAKRTQIRQEGKKFSADRIEEHNFSKKIADDRARTEENRRRSLRFEQAHKQLEEAQAKETHIKALRLAEDIRNGESYAKEWNKWQRQAELDEAEGRPTRPPPERPQGSSIGTEVVTLQSIRQSIRAPFGKSSASLKTASAKEALRFSSDTPAPLPNAAEAAAENLKRKARPLVEVRIHGSKKQKTNSGEATTPEQNLATDSKIDDTAAAVTGMASPRSPFRMRNASQRGEIHRQEDPKVTRRGHLAGNTRESIIPFLSSQAESNAGPDNMTNAKKLPTPLSALASSSSVDKVPDQTLISSDDSSSYSDPDIDEKDYEELAERSSIAMRSSPGGRASQTTPMLLPHDGRSTSANVIEPCRVQVIIPSINGAKQPKTRPTRLSLPPDDIQGISADIMAASNIALELLSGKTSKNTPLATGPAHERAAHVMQNRVGTDANDVSSPELSKKLKVQSISSSLINSQLSKKRDIPLMEDDAMDVEEIDPRDTWRGPPLHDTQSRALHGDSVSESHDSDKDSDDISFDNLDDARAYARERGQFFQGDAKGTWRPEEFDKLSEMERKSFQKNIEGTSMLRSSPPTAQGLFAGNTNTTSMFHGQSLPAYTRLQPNARTPVMTKIPRSSPPLASMDSGRLPHNARMPPNVSMNGHAFGTKMGSVNRYPSTQDVIPPFPSSGRVRTVSPVSESSSKEILDTTLQVNGSDHLQLQARSFETKTTKTKTTISGGSANVAKKQMLKQNARSISKAINRENTSLGENRTSDSRPSWRETLIQERNEAAAAAKAVVSKAPNKKKKKLNAASVPAPAKLADNQPRSSLRKPVANINANAEIMGADEARREINTSPIATRRATRKDSSRKTRSSAIMSQDPAVMVQSKDSLLGSRSGTKDAGNVKTSTALPAGNTKGLGASTARKPATVATTNGIDEVPTVGTQSLKDAAKSSPAKSKSNPTMKPTVPDALPHQPTGDDSSGSSSSSSSSSSSESDSETDSDDELAVSHYDEHGKRKSSTVYALEKMAKQSEFHRRAAAKRLGWDV